jgi:hypothetical protein
MDRRLAALRPSIADQVQFERLADSLARPTPPAIVPDASAPFERPARRVFLAQAGQIQAEAAEQTERNQRLGEAVWGSL